MDVDAVTQLLGSLVKGKGKGSGKGNKGDKGVGRKVTQTKIWNVTTVERKDIKLQIVGQRSKTSPAKETPKDKRVKEKAQTRKARKAPARKAGRSRRV